MTELQPKIAVLKAPGINCDVETAHAFRQAGANPEEVLLQDLKNGEKSLLNYQGLVFSGGFSYGDDLGSGKVLALKLDTYVGNQIQRFKETRPILGICNGFQILARSGLLPMGNIGEMEATLDRNDSGRFISRQVELIMDANSNCVFLKDLKELGSVEFPVAHGEGKFVTSKQTLGQMEKDGQIVFRYSRDGEPTQQFPYNPNGSENAVAGVTDPSGLTFGLMPHPERTPEGLFIFKGMVAYARQGV